MMQEHRQHVKRASAEAKDSWTSRKFLFEIHLETVAQTLM
jgi:hypothetical protein